MCRLWSSARSGTLTVCASPGRRLYHTAYPFQEVTEKEVIVTVETVRTEKAEVVVTQISEISPEAVEVRWFVGLAAGGESEQTDRDQKLLENATLFLSNALVCTFPM